jgi:hypothetical protein
MEPQTETKEAPYSMMTIVVLGGALLIVSSAIGAFIGPMLSVKGGDVAQIASAPLVQASMSAPSQDEVHTLSGKVTAIQGSGFTLHMESAPFGDQTLLDRMVAVTGDTKVTKTEPKDQKIMDPEMTEFMKKLGDMEKNPHILLSPEPFTRTVSSAYDISVGDFVVVKSYENISTKKNFLASEIQFHAPIKATTK